MLISFLKYSRINCRALLASNQRQRLRSNICNEHWRTPSIAQLTSEKDWDTTPKHTSISSESRTSLSNGLEPFVWLACSASTILWCVASTLNMVYLHNPIFAATICLIVVDSYIDRPPMFDVKTMESNTDSGTISGEKIYLYTYTDMPTHSLKLIQNLSSQKIDNHVTSRSKH